MPMYRSLNILILFSVLPMIVPNAPNLFKIASKPEFSSWVGCIDYHQASQYLKLRDKVLTESLNAISSIDLSYSTQDLCFNKDGLSTHNKVNSALLATWDEIEDISKKQQGCYSLYDDGSKPWKISTLSATTGIPVSLCPPLSESGAPTMVMGGFTMHRIAGDNMNPTHDTEAKINSVRIFTGAKVLDTCMGLGYTAIAAARKVDASAGGKVTTIEFDEASIEMSAHNPWSKGLFDGTLPIEIYQGDSCEIIGNFKSASFNVIIHDPPARALCRKDLYGLEFYKELRRVLTSNGVLFHYIGNPSSKESGRLYSGIAARLQDAGFVDVKKVERAFGLTAKAGGGLATMRKSGHLLQMGGRKRERSAVENDFDNESGSEEFE